MSFHHTDHQIVGGLGVVGRDGLVVVLPDVWRVHHLLALERLVAAHDGLGVHETGSDHPGLVELKQRRFQGQARVAPCGGEL